MDNKINNEKYISRAIKLSGFDSLLPGQEAFLLGEEVNLGKDAGKTMALVLKAALHAIDNPESEQLFVTKDSLRVKLMFDNLKYGKASRDVEILHFDSKNIYFNNESYIWFADSLPDEEGKREYSQIFVD
jgi:hypothetical protein